ncbi:DExH-box ATP-dependent RNA helicase [Nymphaea thermarum]|nr:DExH-box ATP-dependent RNA helicase [Nymphaea thermarum]
MWTLTASTFICAYLFLLVAKLKQDSSSTLENIDDWKWKLNMLIRNHDEQEVVSRDRKDRRDYDQIAALANRMGLHSRQYSRIVVVSKFPLPNYRPDLDDKRPQREVIIPTILQRKVDNLLDNFFAQKPRSLLGLPDAAVPNSNGHISPDGSDDGLFDESESQMPTSAILEKILRRRSLQLHEQQQAWQESPEGQKMLLFRRSLPAYKERDTLLKAIMQNQVIIVSGETGCGKTTQLPQYILESEIDAGRGATCSIVCTQPRRISAMAVSERVAAERGEKLGESVGYKVRLEGVKGRDTRLLFCTTGVLLRRLLIDPKLKGVTYVIVDEIHERGMNEVFKAFWRLRVLGTLFQGFTHPVRTHFLENILEVTGYRLTPYNQIDDYGQDKMWKMQKQALRKRKSQIATLVEDALETADFKKYSPRTHESLSCWNSDSIGFNLIENVLCHICRNERPGAVLVFMTGWDDINALKEQLHSHPLLGDPSKVLLLACHGSMASSEQRLIFDKPEGSIRKIVLATNMAETSITINDVVFVVDCGKAKETSYDALNNTPCLLPSWISKASARQRRGRAGRVQPGECYHLYPRCVYDSFAEYQLPELLRTPLQSLCLQIKTLRLGSASEFLSKALQPPELLSVCGVFFELISAMVSYHEYLKYWHITSPLQTMYTNMVQNAIEYLKIIGALDEKENLTILGRHLSMLPVEPKLGKMLILGAMFNCLDPILTVVAGLSVRDPFLTPFDKKELAESAKLQFSAKDYSDHLALIRAYAGWKKADAEGTGYDYCWKNFLSAQTMRAMDSLRKQFLSLLKDAGLVGDGADFCNMWSCDEYLIRSVICAGLYPGVCSAVSSFPDGGHGVLSTFKAIIRVILFMLPSLMVQISFTILEENKEKSISLKTMEDGHVLLYSNSVNGREQRIPYPWLVFNEKVKVNSVFLRDSTAVSDSVLLLFGGNISRGGLDGHLKMLGGYLEFFMKPNLAEMYICIKRELDELIQKKLVTPKMDLRGYESLFSAVRLLVTEDFCQGRFVFGREILKPKTFGASLFQKPGCGPGGDNSKSQLQTLVVRAGYDAPTYQTKQLKNNQFRAIVEFSGMQFVGNPSQNKKLAEKDAAGEALKWLTGSSSTSHEEIENMSLLLKKSKKQQQPRR